MLLVITKVVHKTQNKLKYRGHVSSKTCRTCERFKGKPLNNMYYETKAFVVLAFAWSEFTRTANRHIFKGGILSRGILSGGIMSVIWPMYGGSIGRGAINNAINFYLSTESHFQWSIVVSRPQHRAWLLLIGQVKSVAYTAEKQTIATYLHHRCRNRFYLFLCSSYFNSNTIQDRQALLKAKYYPQVAPVSYAHKEHAKDHVTLTYDFDI